jgi:non-ribosomal peptide synthetase component F
LLRRVRDADLAAFAHQEVPFDQLVTDLDPPRHPARYPLFQVMLVLQNGRPPTCRLADLRVKQLPVAYDPARFDLALIATTEPAPDAAPGVLHGRLVYAAALFDRGTAEQLAAAVRGLLRAAVEHPDVPISEVWARP